jgi:glycosyltransferase involved in cell wall biosynthesis/Tfp pilus assembly protein PilF
MSLAGRREAKPRISLCLVVKNEELFLGECLQAARELVDETIVVDTGSTDRTIEIAEAAGARVYRQPWPGDLGRAHDLPLAYANGDWLLTLDGDEVLDPRFDELTELVRDPGLDGVLFTVRNYVYHPVPQNRRAIPTHPLTRGASFWSPSMNVRLFRNRPAFRHSGRLHQSVLPALRRAGARIVSTTVPIHHYGLLRYDRNKSALYTELAEQEVRDRPDDVKARLELGIVHLNARRLEAARDTFASALALGFAPEASFLLGATLVAHKQPASAIDHLRRAAVAPSPLRFFGEAADVLEVLGQALLDVGDDNAAQKAFSDCLALRPDSPVAACRMAEILARRHAVDQAGQIAEGLIRQYPGLAMTWEAAGYVNLLASRPQAATTHLRRAIDIEPDRVASQFNLAIALARAGNGPGARQTLALARDADREGWLASRLGESPSMLFGRPEVPRLGAHGVLSFIPHLSGGAAYVAFELARALAPDHPHVLATLAPGTFTGEAHRRLLESVGVQAVVVRDADEMRALQEAAEPGVIIHHWWDKTPIDTLVRSGREALVMRCAAARPMPEGYDRYVTLSRFQAQYQSHVPSDRLEVIPNGVDLDRFGSAAPREAFWSHAGPRGQRVRIVMVSRLDPGKFARRLADWLEPLSRLPVAVAIAGRGALRWEIEPELRNRGLDGWIRFLGPVAQDEVPGLLAASDIGLHLTETHQESHSLAILQMMAAGLPIVAQPRGCLPELIEHGSNGFLSFAEADAATHLRRLLEDGDLRARMGRAARHRAQAFGIAPFARRWRTLVQSLLGG